MNRRSLLQTAWLLSQTVLAGRPFSDFRFALERAELAIGRNDYKKIEPVYRRLAGEKRLIVRANCALLANLLENRF